jgi:membrane fusion protein, copper/silver efflux system
MSLYSRMIVSLTTISLAGGAGFYVGKNGVPPEIMAALPETVAMAVAAKLQPSDDMMAAADKKIAKAASGPVIYYRAPDGRAAFSAGPLKDAKGMDYIAVRANEDVSFDQRPAMNDGAMEDKAMAGKSMADKGMAEGGERKIKYYRNPMGLPDTSPMPKKDSMGMDYLPVYEGEDTDDGTIKLTAGKLQKTGVRSEPVELQAITVPIRAPGTIQVDERLVSLVTLRFEGFVDAVENVTTGDRVKKGEPLMKIYGPGLSTAAAEYVTALGAAGDAGSKGARRKLENMDVPEAAIREIERSRKVPASLVWSSPQDGLVMERKAVNGMRAGPGDVLFEVADISKVWALIDLSERDIAMAKVGQTVMLRPRGMPDYVVEGKIALIYPHINKETRTGRVRIELDNQDGRLLPDLYVDAEISTGSDAPVLTVADSAVIDSGNRQIVILDRGDGKFEPRPVKIGQRGNGRTEITEGVSNGDQVVVSANFLIDAESNLKSALQGLGAPETAK